MFTANEMFPLIREWASNRRLIQEGDKQTQYIKLCEELGELGESILKNDHLEFKDAIGDMMVVMTNLCAIVAFHEKRKFSIEDCLAHAWEEIKDRKGTMINGTFVKEPETLDDQGQSEIFS